MNKRAQVKGRVNVEFPQIFPKPGWVEHKPDAIWRSVVKAIGLALESAKLDSSKIAGIGITNQRETLVSWDIKTGRTVGNAIVWQCRRTTEMCERWIAKGLNSQVKKTTGLLLDPYFSGSKMAWLLTQSSDHKKLNQLGRLAFGTIDSYLVWKLTGGKTFATDVSNASRTLLMNIKTLDYDSDMLKIFKVKRESLPKILPSNSSYGVTKKLSNLLSGIPISGVIGDQQSALFGQGCYERGDAKVTFGTGSFLLMNTGNKIVHSKAGLLSTVAWSLEGQRKATYALEGGAFNCGSAVQWLRDGLEFFKNAKEIESLAKKVKDAEGVFFVPAFNGLGAPYWDPEVRGTFTGLTRGTTRAHIARATLESLALQNFDIFQAMKNDAKMSLGKIHVDGGASRNNLLMQLQSDILYAPIFRPKNIESTSLGAGLMAGLGLGWWSDLSDVPILKGVGQQFQPKISLKEQKSMVQAWQALVKKLGRLYRN